MLPLFLWLAISLVCLIVGILLISKKSAATQLLPPQPPGAWPFIGHLPFLRTFSHRTLADLALRHRLELMSLRLGSILVIVASTPAAAKLILRTHDQDFSSRPRSLATQHLGFHNTQISLCPSSRYWRLMRQICTTELFRDEHTIRFRPVREAEVRHFLHALCTEQGEEIQIRSKLMVVLQDIISILVVGQRLSEHPAGMEFVQIMMKVVELGTAFNVGDFLPCLGFLDDVLLGSKKGEIKRVGKKWSSMLQSLLDERRSSAHPNGRIADDQKALLDVLLSKPDMKDYDIKAVISEMLFGGTQTSTYSIEWALAELVANPTKLKALQEELDRVVGVTRLVQEGDIPNLPYLHAVVKETMRLHPVNTLLIPHEAMRECRVQEYVIPPKACALVNIWAIGRNPDVWEKPLEFLPERFLPGAKHHHLSVYGQHFELLPFGSGRRVCPGIPLGLLSVHLFLASLVHAFDLAPYHPRPPQVDLSDKFGVAVTMAKPLAISPTPRLDPSLYQQKL